MADLLAEQGGVRPVERPRVYLVGGYLAPGLLLEPLKRRIAGAGYPVEVFRYPTHRDGVRTHANDLAQRLAVDCRGAPVILVGHSLGGLVVHEAIKKRALNLTRVVFVATPHRGCRVGRNARKLRWPMLLQGAGRQVSHGVEPAPINAETGVIIGTKDRVVSPQEAELPGATRLQLPYGHNGLLVRPRSLAAIVRFIESGRFEETFDPASVVRAGLDQR